MRGLVRFASLVLFVAMISLGFWYPLLGVLVMGYMLLVLLAGGRRRWCSAYCPRGSFYDLVVSRFSGRRPLPRLLRNGLTWKALLLLLLTAMGLQLLWARPWEMEGLSALSALGRIFYRACLVSTAVGVPLALLFNHRAWCATCPIGNLLRL